ncbi:mannose-1-phosphate guanylyltransferase/mannose-6-phosphate isomerase [Sphingosinicella sp. LHD-64]|uniref:mannose-1-phosphate guanylyltransferase/mannose-6-phosphate isomerase n=1 Tax=Sphingosinicella sp. LHD-64 TaxID=3072139 RepID=UPI00280E682D|nr:mannose-1-phosphate guanylyltransferase/mannose-6-phosphate isomerase [Sphingosinicella sp. LHD-64]MDQ8758007.1 mannose-1-phosphate guanylyltransferase/mannose-6-phosphate isomerase [Sphingosinicella sp. LHD-64]
MDSADKDGRITPVILCGGAGTRLWPMSRRDRPKQMLALTGTDSMLRQTVRRVDDPGLYDPALIVGAAAQAEAIAAEVGAAARLVLEPAPRNTAPAIALAALNMPAETVLLVLPSDHSIGDADGFNQAVRRGLPFAQAGWIVTFGMTPDRPETGYGYIRRGAPLGDGLFAVDRFVEKPDAQTAARYLAEGGHDWNGGIFLMRADVVIDGLARHAPDILAAVRDAVEGQNAGNGRIEPDAAAFASAPAVSIDYALMEKAEKVAVAPVSIGWSDIGSWEALHENAARGPARNDVGGDIIAIDVRDCLIRSEGPLVAVVGVENLVVVATPDAVLVVPRDQSQRVKDIVDRLKAEGRDACL